MSDVRVRTLGRPVLYALVLLGGYLAYLVLAPFVVALTWAVLFAILFRRMQVALVSTIGANGAALVTTLCVAVLIVAPAMMLISTLAREVPQVSDYVRQASQRAPHQIQQVWDAVKARSPVAIPDDPMDFITTGAQRLVSFLAPHAGALVADVFASLGTLADAEALSTD